MVELIKKEDVIKALENINVETLAKCLSLKQPSSGYFFSVILLIFDYFRRS